jgi:hypothetical protein
MRVAEARKEDGIKTKRRTSQGHIKMESWKYQVSMTRTRISALFQQTKIYTQEAGGNPFF